MGTTSVRSVTTELGSLYALAIRHRFLLLTALGVLLYVSALGRTDLWYPDEPVIGEVAKAMYESGDWVAPRSMGEIWVDYPPVLYWAGTAASRLLGGVSPFSLRLAPAVFAIALLCITCWAGSRGWSPATGLWAGFALATFSRFSWEAVNFRPDMPFALFLAAGLLLYAESSEATGPEERVRGWALRAGGFALLGLAVLSKGPLGLLLPGLVLVLWHGARREVRRIVELAPLTLIALAVAFPWYYLCGRAMGYASLWNDIYRQNFHRFESGEIGHAQPFPYYFTSLPVDLLPWSLLVPFAIWWLLRSDAWRLPRVQLALWWAGTFVVFLSFAATKRQVYLLPCYPAFALLLAPWMAASTGALGSMAAPSRRPAKAFVIGAALALAVFGLIFAGTGFGLGSLVGRVDLDSRQIESALGMRWQLMALGLTSLAAALWIGQASLRGKTSEPNGLRAGLWRVGLAQVALCFVAFMWLRPAVNPLKTYAPQSRWIRAEIGSQSTIGMLDPIYGERKKEAFGYYSGASVEVLYSRGEMKRFFRRHPKTVVLVYEDNVAEIAAEHPGEWQPEVVHEFRVSSHRYLVVRSSTPTPVSEPSLDPSSLLTDGVGEAGAEVVGPSGP